MFLGMCDLDRPYSRMKIGSSVSSYESFETAGIYSETRVRCHQADRSSPGRVNR